jgi:hypothetical protein
VRYLGDLLLGGDLLGQRLERLDDLVHGQLRAALEVHGIHARSHGLAALAEEGGG